MTVLDTSVLIEMVGAGGSMQTDLRQAISAGERIVLPTLVLYEWLRGPRVTEELAAQAALFPAEDAIPFGADEAALAAQLYVTVTRPREMDLAIAACALSWNAALWTLNPKDFQDVPRLRLRS